MSAEDEKNAATVDVDKSADSAGEENKKPEKEPVKPEPLTDADFDEHMAKLTGITISSDAFFPFRDNIDTCAKFGVKYIVQPGGSVADDKVTEACDQYDMVQGHHGMRLFHH